MINENKQWTNAELLSADPIRDNLSTQDISRRTELMKAVAADLDVQDLRDRLDERKNKKEEIRERYTSRGRELRKTEVDQKKHQDGCSHRKGGRSIEALQKGGNAADYAVIRHVLPTNELWQRCQRCGKTWRPPHPQDFDIKTADGRADFEEAKKVYKEALTWPTDNIQSSGITFEHKSEGDGNAAADDFVHEVMKGTDLR